MIVKELFAMLGFKVDDKGLTEFNEKIAAAAASATGLTAVVVGAATSLFGLAVHTAHAAEEFDILSKRTGVNVEDLQGLAFAAKTTGEDTEQLAMHLNFLNQSMFNARKGSKEAAQAFALVGGNVARMVQRGAPTIEVIKAIADRFKDINDPAKAASVAAHLFGRGASTLIPLLKKGSDGIEELTSKAEELGIVMSEDAVHAGEEFMNQLTMSKGILTGFKNAMGATLIQGMLPAIKALNEWFLANAKIIKQGLNEFVEDLGKSIKTTWGYFKNLATLVQRLTAPFGGLLAVVKNLVFAFMLYKQIKFIAALGEATMVIFNMAKAFNMVKLAAMAANAAAMAIPLLVGAAVIGFLLLLEDIAVYLEGGDSFIGVLFQKVPELLNFLKTSFGPVFEPIMELFNGLKNGTLDWVDALKLVGTTIVNVLLTPFRSLMSMLGNLASFAGRISGSEALANKAGMFNTAADFLSLSTPGSAPATGAASPANNLNNQVTQNITNNFGQVDDPAAISSKVSDASSSGLDEVLRFSGRNLQRGRAY